MACRGYPLSSGTAGELLSLTTRQFWDVFPISERTEVPTISVLYPAQYDSFKHVHIMSVDDKAAISLWDNNAADTRLPDAFIEMTKGELISYLEFALERLKAGVSTEFERRNCFLGSATKK